MIEIALTSFVTLFVIIDPIGLTPIFVALTSGMEDDARRAIALRASLVGLGVLLVFGLAGQRILDLVGIGMPAFRIAGGMLLFLTALDMLFEKRRPRQEQSVARHTAAHGDDPAVFPLATPLIAGPGAMATIILLVEQQPGMAEKAVVFGVMTAVIFTGFLLFLLAGVLERGLGPLGINVVTRLLGMLLAALSVQFVIDGVREAGLGAG